jgi:hypothetical protein
VFAGCLPGASLAQEMKSPRPGDLNHRAGRFLLVISLPSATALGA